MSLDSLKSRYPWPAERPDRPGEDWHGWLCDGTARLITSLCHAETAIVVECGSWLGLSARAILTHAPAATVVCVDHWRGSPEHQPEAGIQEWSRRLNGLYDQCLHNLWPWRERVVPLRADSLGGLREIAEAGLSPNFVYLDSEHTVDRVSRELAFCHAVWPRMPIVGDDIDNAAVEEAVLEFREKTKRPLRRDHGGFLFEP